MEEREIDKVLRKSKITLIITLIFLVITLGLIAGGFYLDYNATKEPRNLGELIYNYEETEGQYVKVDVTTVPYGFAEEGEGKYYYFVMDENQYLYIVRITDKTYEEMESQYTEENPTIHYEIKGYTFQIPSDLKKLAIEAGNELFEQEFLNLANFEEYVGSVYIDETQKPDNDMSMVLYAISVISGVFTFVLFIVTISNSRTTSKVMKNKELIEDVKDELAGLTDNPYQKLKMYLTNKYIVSKTGGLEIIEYKDVIWVYSQIRYVNGIAQGKTLMLCTRDKKKHQMANTGANDTRIDEIMVEIKDKNEKVRIGYTKENREFYKQFPKETI